MSLASPNPISWRIAALLGLLAAVLHLEVLNRTPLLDDWWILPRVIENGSPTPWPKTDDGSAIALGARHAGEPVPPPYMSRPLLWGAWRFVSKFSTVIPIVALHGLSLLAHALSTMLFARLLGNWVKRGPAVLATILFALSPGGAQAISWIAAGGDVLCLPFVLFAALLVTRMFADPQGPTWMLLVAIGAAVAALLMKESAVALIPALFVVGVACSRHVKWFILAVHFSSSIFALTTVASWLRGWLMGAGRRGGGEIEPPTLEALLNLPYNTAQLFLQALVPVNAEGAAASSVVGLSVWLRILGCACIAIVVVLGLVSATRPRRWGIVACLGLFVVAVGPVCCVVLVQATTIHNNFFSRLVYAPWCAILAALALAIDAVTARWAKWIAMGAMGLLTVGAVLALAHVRGNERVVDQLVAARLDAVRATPEGTTSIVVDPHAFFQGSPVIGFGIEDAFCGMFDLPRRYVIWAPDVESLQRAQRLTTVTGPLCVIDFTENPRGNVTSIRSSSAAEPSEGSQPITDNMAIDPAGPVAPQRIHGITLYGEALGPAVVTTWFAGSQVLTVAQPVRKGGRFHSIEAPQDRAWPLASVVDRVRIEGLALGASWEWSIRPLPSPSEELFPAVKKVGFEPLGTVYLEIVDRGDASHPPKLMAEWIDDATSLTVVWRFHVQQGSQVAWAMAVRELPCSQEGAPEDRKMAIKPTIDDLIGFAGASSGMKWRDAIATLTRPIDGEPRRRFLQYEVQVIARNTEWRRFASPWVLGHLRLD